MGNFSICRSLTGKKVMSISTGCTPVYETTLRYFLAGIMLFLGLLFSLRAAGQATVTTDKDDYQPGNYVIVTGAGWQPGETVALDFDETPQVCTSDHHRLATADANGNIYYDQFLINEKHLGVSFVLTATGQSSGRNAVTYFTDATWTLGVNPNSFCGFETKLVTFTITQANNAFPRNSSFTVIMPSGYEVLSSPAPMITGSPAGKNWTVSRENSTTLCLKGATSGDELANNQVITFTATVKAPNVFGTSAVLAGRGNGGAAGHIPTCNSLSGQAITNPPTFNVSGASGIDESYAIINFGGANVYYDLNINTGNPDFEGTNLGSYNATDILKLNGAQNKIFKCGSRDIINGTLYYRIYPAGSPSGAYNTSSMGYSTGSSSGSCTNQTWEQAGANINLLNGLCDGNYTLEIYTGANYQGCGSGEHLLNNGGNNYKATFSVSNTNRSGIFQTALVLKLNGGGDSYYDLLGNTPNYDFTGNLGTFCPGGSLVIAGAEQKTFKCPNNDILDKNKLFYRVYPAGSPSGAFVPFNLGFISNDPGALCMGGQNQTWRNTSGNTNILTGLLPGNYTLEVYTQASYTTNGICELIHYANNGGNNYTANFSIEDNTAPIPDVTTLPDLTGECSATVRAAPTATDNCSGSITGTTSDPLTYNTQGTYTITWSYDDGNGNTSQQTQIVVVDDITAPVPDVTNLQVINAICSVTPTAPKATDNCTGTITATSNVAFPISAIGTTVITWTYNDGNGNTSTQTQTVNVSAVTVDANASSIPVPVTSPVVLKATISSPTAGITIEFFVNGVSAGTDLTDGAGYAELNIGIKPLGVYEVIARALPNCGQSYPAYVPVYDGSGNFVTGGGWINSPAGALTADPAVTGKANFGFVSKYKKGTNQVDGNTEFQFHAGDINFKSAFHESGSLVITTGNRKATYRGEGTVNGVPGFKFTIIAFDGQFDGGTDPDKFRIKIWNAGGVVYDNQTGSPDNSDNATVIGGGSIVIHQTGKKSAELITAVEAGKLEIRVANNPSQGGTAFKVQVVSNDTQLPVNLRMLDMRGQPVELRRNLQSGTTIEFGSGYTPGMYLIEALQGNKRVIAKVLKQ